jgi:radical SAM superfamily enzyme YgiQ (UPF0313 family)
MNRKPECSKAAVLLLYRSADIGSIDQAKSLKPPIGLYFLSARLDSANVSSAVNNFSALPFEEQAERLLRYAPSYVGISMMTSNRFSSMELAGSVKELLPNAKVILGGPHASEMPEAILSRVPAVDAVVIGEGEDSFEELIRFWEEGKEISEVRGIAYRQGGRSVRTRPRSPISNLDRLPHPAGKFAYENIGTSRGCTYRCGFCASSRFWGSGIRYHSADWVADEIEMLYRNHGIREFRINDDVFTLNRERTIAVCKEILARGLYIRFRCMSRVNTLCPERLAWLRKAGCYQIDFGVESGSDRILKAMGKKADVEQAVKAFRMTREAGVRTGCFLLIGYPGEDDRSISETKQLVRKLRPGWCDLSSMALFPGSPIHRRLLEKGKIDEDIWFSMKDHTLFIVEDGNRDRYVRYLNELRADYEKHRPSYEPTLTERKRVLDATGGSGFAASELAQALCACGENKEALKILAEASKKEALNPFLWHEISQLCLHLGDMRLALSASEKALMLQPGNYETLRLAARVSAKSGDVDAAEALLMSAIEPRPERIEAWIELGELYQKTGRFMGAVEAYRSASIIDPFWAPLKEAMEDCRRRIAASPSAV